MSRKLVGFSLLVLLATQFACSLGQPTKTPVSVTPEYATQTPAPTSTPQPRIEVVVSTPPKVPFGPASYSDRYSALYLEDKTVPDRTVMVPGQVFVKTWRVKNVGSAPWEGDVYLVNVSVQCRDYPALCAGELTLIPEDAILVPMTETSSLQVTTTASDGTIEISVELEAPLEPGLYCSLWTFWGPAGRFMDELFVLIQVVAPQ